MARFRFMQKVTISVILYFFTSYTYSQFSDYRLHHLSIEDGLSQSSVYAIHKDSKGYMWFGTIDGLNKYDGHKITTYNNEPNCPNCIYDDNISDIKEDKKGNLWIFTGLHLQKFDPKLEKFHIYNPPSDTASLTGKRIYNFHIDKKGVIWVCTSKGVYTYNQNKNQFEEFTIEKEILNKINCFKLLEDNQQNIWLSTTRGIIKINTERSNAQLFRSSFEEISKNNDSTASIIAKDKLGNIYYRTVTDNSLIIRIDAASNKITQTKLPKKTYNQFTINSFTFNRNNEILIGTSQGLYLMNSNQESVQLILPTKDKPHQANFITNLLSNNQNIWIGTADGLYKQNESGTISKIQLHNEVNTVIDLFCDSNNQIWVITQTGINVYNQEKEQLYNLKKDFKNNIFGNKLIRSHFEDNDGKIWLGSDGDGLWIYDQNSIKFTTPYFTEDEDKGKFYDPIWGIYEDEDVLWVGTSSYGIYTTNLSSNKIKLANRSNQFRNVRFLNKDERGNIWAAHWSNGLKKINSKTFEEQIILQSKDSIPVKFSNIMYIIPDGNFLWLAEWDGLRKLNIADLSSELFYKADAKIPFTFLLPDENNQIWIGSQGGGLFVFDKETKEFRQYKHNPNDTLSLSDNVVMSINIDKKGNKWIGTRNGLNLFQEKNGTVTFKKWTLKDGLPNSFIYGILDDNEGNLWISTNRGLSKFETQNNQFINYGMPDGLPSEEFNAGVLHKGKSGTLYFGGIKGIVAFNPSTLNHSHHMPPVEITGVKINHKKISAGIDSHISQNISFVKEITLKHYENDISLYFTALDFSFIKRNQYVYKLEGFDEDWITGNESRTATYTNLPPGDYRFMVKATNVDGIWGNNTRELKITILKPWYAKLWAQFLFVLIAGLIVFGIFKIRLRNIKRQKRQLEIIVKDRTEEIHQQNEEILAQNNEIETQKQHLEEQNKEIRKQKLAAEEANKAKSIFLANMSHEIRTPLNSIIGFTDILYDSCENQQEKEYLDAVKTSGSSLLSLINDILDFSKLEAGKVELAEETTDIHNLINSIKQVFSVLVKEKGLEFIVEINPEIPNNLNLDRFRLRQIINNLVSNALKFTEKGAIKIAVNYYNNNDGSIDLTIKVKDTGKGISKDNVNKIFNAFEQENKLIEGKFGGTGLGLSICEQLIKLMNGEISVVSEPGKMTVFTILLKDIEISEITEDHENEDFSKFEDLVFNRGKILIADDIRFNRILLKAIFAKTNLETIEAENGKQVLDIIEWNKPDAILMDIKMPEMNGDEATRIIKEHPNYKNIPVIALTASVIKEDNKDMVELFDSYITKPFKKGKLFFELSKHLHISEPANIQD